MDNRIIMINSEKLDKWAEQLLDTGKGSNLISFKDTKYTTAQVLVPSAQVLFSKLEKTAAFEVFDPKIPDEVPGEFEPESSAGRALSCEEFLERYSNRIRKQNQLLVYSTGGNPSLTMRMIERRANDFLEETGVNVAYMAFGFVHWKDHSAAEEENLAPVLLVPVRLSRRSATDPYMIRSEESEVIVNPTFAYKLEAEYGIRLPEYSDEGLDSYLSETGRMLGRLSWTVSDECRIGIFSFLKINMYQDLRNNTDLILQNQSIRNLLGDPIEQITQPVKTVQTEPAGNPLIELHSVIDADSSQIEAIELARSGESFVLQGPPGTGKSQTITNIIAECLCEGRKVLFVSEKLAALNVVFTKLKQAGLGDFCLELHSYKSSRKAVIQELCRTLKADVSAVSSRADGEIEQKKLAQNQLNSYAYELHRKRERINLSLYQLFELHSSVRSAPDVNWHFEHIETRDETCFRDACALLRQYAEFVPTVGYRYKENPWYGYREQKVTYETKLRMEGNLKTAGEMLETLIPVSEWIEGETGIPVRSASDMKQWETFSGVLEHTVFLTPQSLQERELDRRISVIEQLRQLSSHILKQRSDISAQYEETVYRLDSAGAYNRLTKLYGNFFSRLFSQDYYRIQNEYHLCRKDGRKPEYEELSAISGTLKRLKEEEAEFERTASAVQGIFQSGYNGLYTDWNTLLSELNTARESLACFGTFGVLPKLTDTEFRIEAKKFAETGQTLSEAFLTGGRALRELADVFDETAADFYHCTAAKALERVKACEKQIDKLENWCQFRALLSQLNQIGIQSYIDEAIREDLPVEDMVPSFRKRFYSQWITGILLSVPVLAGFTRIAQDDAVSVFSEKDREQFDISKAVIRSRLSHARPSLDVVAGGSAVSTLLHEGAKKRRQKSIRKLLTETGDLVQKIKPCFLMSPLSVSTFLDPNVIHFDVVIFDEASQIFPQDAVGAIYRADQAIIVGDSRQMPPSNFFSANIEPAGGEDEESITDFESILDLCSTCMRQLRLKWHYRSRYEQLITFSNRNFYDGDLVTFPSSVRDHTGIGIDYFHTDGLFDRRTHTNRKEAEFIVDLIYENFSRYPERSLGVVAFSVAQQNLIEHLLNRRRILAPEAEHFFSSEAKEPFFIKNLETVQGDERDTIIFSVAYGRDAQGRLLLNFGPLSKAGGERRLNVAVTRAKCNVQIVSSMHHTDIDLERAKSEGARLLREYLDYAENGSAALERSQKSSGYDQTDSEFELEVCEFLRSNGYTVDTQIGCSGYRIDMGVRKPGSEDYVLAVECDGDTYHSSGNTRDRDRLRQEVLQRMGWKFYRVWSCDWFRNQAVEKERLLKAVSEAVSEPENTEPMTVIRKSAQLTEFEDPVERHLSFPAYQAADVERLMKECGGDYRKLVYEILEIEAPLSEELLLRRTYAFFGREKVTKYVRDRYEEAMKNCESYGIIRKNGFLYRKEMKKTVFRGPGDLVRDVKYISPEELASGLLTILKQNVTAGRDGLYKAMAEQCGLKRPGTAVTAAFDEAMDYLCALGLTEENDGQISIK